MAFKIALSPSYRVKVVVETLNAAGRSEKSDFHVEFKRVDMARIAELRTMTQEEVLREVIEGFDGLVDESGTEVGFNEINLAMLLSIPAALFALADAFWTSIYKAKEKN